MSKEIDKDLLRTVRLSTAIENAGLLITTGLLAIAWSVAEGLSQLAMFIFCFMWGLGLIKQIVTDPKTLRKQASKLLRDDDEVLGEAKSQTKKEP